MNSGRTVLMAQGAPVTVLVPRKTAHSAAAKAAVDPIGAVAQERARQDGSRRASQCLNASISRLRQAELHALPSGYSALWRSGYGDASRSASRLDRALRGDHPDRMVGATELPVGPG